MTVATPCAKPQLPWKGDECVRNIRYCIPYEYCTKYTYSVDNEWHYRQ